MKTVRTVAALILVYAILQASSALLAQTAHNVADPSAVVRRHLDLLNRGDLREAAELFAPDVRHHLGTWLGGSERIVQGRQTLMDNLQDIFTTFPDWKMEIVDMVADGESVVVRCRVTGTHRGKGTKRINGGR